jgi:hypothetical protein
MTRFGSKLAAIAVHQPKEATLSERTSLTDEQIRTEVAQEIREQTADADMDDADTADTDDTDSDSDDTDS